MPNNTKTPKKTTTPQAPANPELLAMINDNRHLTQQSPVQLVQPVDEKKENAAETGASSDKSVHTPIRSNVNTQKCINTKSVTTEEKGVGGKPTLKKDGVKYSRLSPNIPAELKLDMDTAILHGRYTDVEGQTIRYIDEFVAEAVRRMLTQKQDKQ